MHDDAELRREFAALREAGRRSAPGFEAVLRRPTAPVRIRRGRLAMLAAATIVLAVGIARMTRSDSPAPMTLAEISQWQPETDLLLDPPLVGLGTLTEPVGSLLDAMPAAIPDGDPLR